MPSKIAVVNISPIGFLGVDGFCTFFAVLSWSNALIIMNEVSKDRYVAGNKYKARLPFPRKIDDILPIMKTGLGAVERAYIDIGFFVSLCPISFEVDGYPQISPIIVIKSKL